jgi:hypothetical protein
MTIWTEPARPGAPPQGPARDGPKLRLPDPAPTVDANVGAIASRNLPKQTTSAASKPFDATVPTMPSSTVPGVNSIGATKAPSELPALAGPSRLRADIRERATVVNDSPGPASVSTAPGPNAGHQAAKPVAAPFKSTAAAPSESRSPAVTTTNVGAESPRPPSASLATDPSNPGGNAAEPARKPSMLALTEPKSKAPPTPSAANAPPAPSPPIQLIKPAANPKTPTTPALAGASVAPSLAAKAPAANAAVETLGVTRLELCSSVAGFGRYERLDPSRIQAGRRLTLYSELEGVSWRPVDGESEARLECRVEIRPASGDAPWVVQFEPIVDRAQAARKDFFCHFTFVLPEELAGRKAQVNLVIRDRVGGGTAERSMPLSIPPSRTDR